MENQLPVVGKDKKRSPQVGLQDLGKVPPQAIDMEEAVLGALMLEKNAVNQSIEILKPESFYKETHQRIFGAIQALFGESEPIDILTVTQKLRESGELDLVGGPYYISQLTNRVASTAHVEFHARIIAEKYIQRKLIEISSDIIKEAYDESSDVFDLLSKAEASLFQVAEGNLRKSYENMRDVLRKAVEEIEKARDQKDGVSGVPTGFRDLDRITGGWQKSDMIVLAARPGMGKTAFILSMARNTAVDFNKGVAVFSLEMSSVQLVNRLISSETGISSEKLRKGNLEEHELIQLHERLGRLANAPIYIDDTPALSVFELRAKCRRLKAQHDIQMVLIDYLQLMSAGNSKGNREQEISTISRSIKEIAKEISVPIVALSQLSRSVETRGGDKKPMLSDLRESGAIEQDADLVAFVYRPEYYGILEDENGNSTEGTGEIIIAKNRHGATDAVRLKFIGRLIKFANLDEVDEGDPGARPMELPGAGMTPNTGFDQPSVIKSSKMNDSEDDMDFTRNEGFDETPF